ncbi:MAG: hypothetical protein HY671_08150 [Chloroflexi bacterium]|nr:hypothetical protein [Chloroflexota bacterium]
MRNSETAAGHNYRPPLVVGVAERWLVLIGGVMCYLDIPIRVILGPLSNVRRPASTNYLPALAPVFSSTIGLPQQTMSQAPSSRHALATVTLM